jgi:hypothetical protein
MEELHEGPSCQRSAIERTVLIGHLAAAARHGQGFVMPDLTDREVLEAILTSCQHVHVKLDQILDLFGEDGEEEDEVDG